jgi:hypothetical protein
MIEFVNSLNNKLKDTTPFRIVLILCSILFIIFREPALLLYPRLWGEEGSIFYQFALHHSLYEIFTTAHVGYLTLFNSVVSTLQAKVFSVESAPIVSTYMGFAVQLIPVYIVAFTTYSFWNTPVKKIICTLIIIVTTAPEQWLNTTNSHFIFGIITFLIMVISANELSLFQKYFFRVLLFIGALTGPASIFFTPIFLLKTYKEKSKEKYIQAAIIVVFAMVQALSILYSILFNNKYNRLSEHNYARTAWHFAIDNFSMVSSVSTSYFNPAFHCLVIFFGAVTGIIFISLLIKGRKNIDQLIPLLSILIVGVFSTLGSLHMAGGPRYAYIPTCILMLFFSSEMFDMKKNNIKKITLVLSVAFLICFSMYLTDYRRSMITVYQSWYPKWENELAKHKANASHNPRIHPGTDPWQVEL